MNQETEVKLGSKLVIRVVSRTTSQKDSKTLIRLLNTDSAAKRGNKKLKRHREQNHTPKRRGGRLYGGRPSKIRIVNGLPGETAIVQVTPEIQRMIRCVGYALNILSLTEISDEATPEVVVCPAASPRMVSAPAEGFALRPFGKQKSIQAIPLPAIGETLRYKIRFPDFRARKDALANRVCRDIAAFSKSFPFVASEATPHTENDKAELEFRFDVLRRRYGAVIVLDPIYLLDNDFESMYGASARSACTCGSPGMAEVLQRIGCTATNGRKRGTGVTIAIVDTGIDGNQPEFPIARRHPASGYSANGNPWSDWSGHGTMCAAIAAGEPVRRFAGVAPGSFLLSYDAGSKTANKTPALNNSSLIIAYEELLERVLKPHPDQPVVVSNSWGLFPIHLRVKEWAKLSQQQRADHMRDWKDSQEDHLQLEAIMGEVASAGAVIVCSAGNYHELAGGLPTDHQPNSILKYGRKCSRNTLTVATCDLKDQMWSYSSRGPGEHFVSNSQALKPDVTAPTPENGCILFGRDGLAFKTGWGTSGACPQVSGLAAALLELHPSIPRSELFEIVLSTATPIAGVHEYCQGAGVINVSLAEDELRLRKGVL